MPLFTALWSRVHDPRGGDLPEKLGGGVRHVSWNLYPISDQNLWFSLPYFRPDDNSLARYRYKQNQNFGILLATLDALLRHQTLSYFPQIGLGETPDRMSRWSFELVNEILKVPVFVCVFFILSIRNLDLQSGVCCIK